MEPLTYYLLLSINEVIIFLVGTAFLTLILSSQKCDSFLKEWSGSRTILFYMIFYEIAALTVMIDGIADNYDLYQRNGYMDMTMSFIKILSYITTHELFFILMIEKLYYPFKETIHKMSMYNITILIIISLCIETYHFFLRLIFHFDWFPQIQAWLVLPLMIIGISFGILLICIFGRKLFAVIVPSRKSLTYRRDLLSKTPGSQFTALSRMSLSAHQLSLIRAITKNVVLSIWAIISRNLEVLIFGIDRIAQHELEKHGNKTMYILIVIAYILMNICLFMELLCIYLSYSNFIGVTVWYKRLCGESSLMMSVVF